MFNDSRSKSLVLVAHCILNANAISDGTADYPAIAAKVVDLLTELRLGILQMPCPELYCLGLDRANINGGESPVLVENSRIRQCLVQPHTMAKVKEIVRHIVFQLEEYKKHNFEIVGLIGINRSPSCGVNTSSMNNDEIPGQGVFIEELILELNRKKISLNCIGIKTSRLDKSIEDLKHFFNHHK